MKRTHLSSHATLLITCICVGLFGAAYVNAQIPLPSADWLPTPDEIRRAPAFPLFDATCNGADQFRLPPDTKVDYQFGPDDHTVTDFPVFPGGPAASQRDRQIRITEHALKAPRFTQQVRLFDETLRIQLTRYADPAQVAALLEGNRNYDRQMGQLGENVAIGEDGYFSSLATNKSLNLAVKQGPFHVSISISTQFGRFQNYWPDQCVAKLKELETYVARLIVSRLPAIPQGSKPPGQPPTVTDPPKPPIVAPPKPPLDPPPPQPTPSRRYRVFIDGQLMRTQAPPTEVNGRILVGLADIFRELGANVVWDGAQRKITATRGSRVVELWIGRQSALVDGSSVILDVPPLILAGGKTYVPVRFVSQALGAGVAYDSRNAAVMISTGSMPPLGGTPTTPPYTPPPPAQGTVQVSTCRETGLRATGLCPNTVTRPFAPNAVPGPCTTHAQGPKLIVTSPTKGATVPERFTISGTGIPGHNLRVTVLAQATLKATGQNATSRILDNAVAKVGTDGRWSIQVNARPVCRDQRVTLKQFDITVELLLNGKVAEKVQLVVQP